MAFKWELNSYKKWSLEVKKYYDYNVLYPLYTRAKGAFQLGFLLESITRSRKITPKQGMLLSQNPMLMGSIPSGVHSQQEFSTVHGFLGTTERPPWCYCQSLCFAVLDGWDSVSTWAQWRPNQSQILIDFIGFLVASRFRGCALEPYPTVQLPPSARLQLSFLPLHPQCRMLLQLSDSWRSKHDRSLKSWCPNLSLNRCEFPWWCACQNLWHG